MLDPMKSKIIRGCPASSPARNDRIQSAPYPVQATRPLSPMVFKIRSAKKNVKQDITDFFTNTSFTALSRIYKANSLLVRLAWTLVVLSMMIWLGVQCCWLLDKYFRYPIDVKFDLKISSELEFPSVTICNMNPILKSRVKDLHFQDLEHLSKRPEEDELLKTTREKYLMAPEQRPCKSTEFVCKNNRCVLQRFRCDGRNDCGNNLDEMNCDNYKCKDGYFKCKDNTCRNKTLLCDGRDDCSDGDDEKNCDGHVCNKGSFQCSDYTCRSNTSVCDGKSDCPDGEDEKNCKYHNCMMGYTKCSNGVCIEEQQWCDGRNNCKGGEDEQMCKKHTCLSGYTKCANGVCILKQHWCNGYKDCKGGEDELNCKNHTCIKGYTKCSDGVCISKKSWCNVIQNCKGGEDELKCKDHVCPKGYLRCSDQACYPSWHRCDGSPFCPDGEDEEDCEDYVCNENRFKCSDNMCWSKFFLCNGPRDCPDGEDEQNCNVTATCPNGLFACPNEGNCMPNSYLNDGFVDCITGADEWLKQNASSKRKNSRSKRDAEDEDEDIYNLLDSMDLVQNGGLASGHSSHELYHPSGNDDGAAQELDPLSTVNIYHGFHHLRNNFPMKRDSVVNSRNKRDTSDESDISEEDLESEEEYLELNEEGEESFSKWETLSNSSFETIRYYSRRGSDWQAAMAYGYVSAKTNNTILEKSGHRKENFIASCEFNGYQCSPSNFTFVHNHKYGSCFTFNSMGPDLRTRFQGPENGLRLELFINQRGYVANLATEAGARIVVHKRGTMPFPEDNGISVMPGRSTSIGLHQMRLSRLPHPHGNCDGDKFNMDMYAHLKGTEYSKLSCMKSCYQLLIIETCGCAAPFYMVSPDMQVCDMLHIETETCVSGLFTNGRFKSCEDKCPQPCEEIAYEVSISSSKWPSDQYQDYLKERLFSSNSEYFNSRIEDDFAKVQIYYQDMIFTHIQQNKAYESMNLISDLGGQLGLWLGLSAITIGELCSFLLILSRSVTSTWLSGAVTSPNEVGTHSANMATTRGNLR